MKRYAAIIRYTTLALLACAPAHAQTDASPHGFQLRIGVSHPGNADAKRYGGNTPLSLGIDFLQAQGQNSNQPGFYFDYTGADRHGGHVKTYGFGAEVVASSDLDDNSAQPYGGAGVGVYQTDVNNPSKNENGKSTTLGGKIFTGYRYKNWMWEINYQFLSKVKNADPSGFGIQIGIPLR